MLVDVIGNKDASAITELDFDHYCQRITKAARRYEWSAQTQQSYTRGVMGLLSFLSEIKIANIHIPSLWAIRKKRLAKVKREPYVLPDGVEDFTKAIYSVPPPPKADKTYKQFIMEHAFIAALVSSGGRIGGVLAIEVSKISGTYTVVKSKNRWVRLNFTSKAMEIINRWIAERDTYSPYLFPAIRDRQRKTLSTKTGRAILYRWLNMVLGTRNEIIPHTFRHFAIIQGIKARGLRWAQIQAGHSSPAITAAYDTEAADEVTEAYDSVYS